MVYDVGEEGGAGAGAGVLGERGVRLGRGRVVTRRNERTHFYTRDCCARPLSANHLPRPCPVVLDGSRNTLVGAVSCTPCVSGFAIRGCEEAGARKLRSVVLGIAVQETYSRRRLPRESKFIIQASA